MICWFGQSQRLLPKPIQSMGLPKREVASTPKHCVLSPRKLFGFARAGTIPCIHRSVDHWTLQRYIETESDAAELNSDLQLPSIFSHSQIFRLHNSYPALCTLPRIETINTSGPQHPTMFSSSILAASLLGAASALPSWSSSSSSSSTSSSSSQGISFDANVSRYRRRLPYVSVMHQLTRT